MMDGKKRNAGFDSSMARPLQECSASAEMPPKAKKPRAENALPLFAPDGVIPCRNKTISKPNDFFTGSKKPQSTDQPDLKIDAPSTPRPKTDSGCGGISKRDQLSTFNEIKSKYPQYKQLKPCYVDANKGNVSNLPSHLIPEKLPHGKNSKGSGGLKNPNPKLILKRNDPGKEKYYNTIIIKKVPLDELEKSGTNNVIKNVGELPEWKSEAINSTDAAAGCPYPTVATSWVEMISSPTIVGDKFTKPKNRVNFKRQQSKQVTGKNAKQTTDSKDFNENNDHKKIIKPVSVNAGKYPGSKGIPELGNYRIPKITDKEAKAENKLTLKQEKLDVSGVSSSSTLFSTKTTRKSSSFKEKSKSQRDNHKKKNGKGKTHLKKGEKLGQTVETPSRNDNLDVYNFTGGENSCSDGPPLLESENEREENGNSENGTIPLLNEQNPSFLSIAHNILDTDETLLAKPKKCKGRKRKIPLVEPENIKDTDYQPSSKRVPPFTQINDQEKKIERQAKIVAAEQIRKFLTQEEKERVENEIREREERKEKLANAYYSERPRINYASSYTTESNTRSKQTMTTPEPYRRNAYGYDKNIIDIEELDHNDPKIRRDIHNHLHPQAPIVIDLEDYEEIASDQGYPLTFPNEENNFAVSQESNIKKESPDMPEWEHEENIGLSMENDGNLECFSEGHFGPPEDIFEEQSDHQEYALENDYSDHQNNKSLIRKTKNILQDEYGDREIDSNVSVYEICDKNKDFTRNEHLFASDENHDSVDENEDAVDENEDAVDGNEDAVDGNEDAVDGNEDAVYENEDAVDGNEDAVDGNEDAVYENEDAVYENEDAVYENEDSIDKNQDSVDESQEGVEIIDGHNIEEADSNLDELVTTTKALDETLLYFNDNGENRTEMENVLKENPACTITEENTDDIADNLESKINSTSVICLSPEKLCDCAILSRQEDLNAYQDNWGKIVFDNCQLYRMKFFQPQVNEENYTTLKSPNQPILENLTVEEPQGTGQFQLKTNLNEVINILEKSKTQNEAGENNLDDFENDKEGNEKDYPSEIDKMLYPEQSKKIKLDEYSSMMMMIPNKKKLLENGSSIENVMRIPSDFKERENFVRLHYSDCKYAEFVSLGKEPSHQTYILDISKEEMDSKHCSPRVDFESDCISNSSNQDSGGQRKQTEISNNMEEIFKIILLNSDGSECPCSFLQIVEIPDTGNFQNDVICFNMNCNVPYCTQKNCLKVLNNYPGNYDIPINIHQSLSNESEKMVVAEDENVNKGEIHNQELDSICGDFDIGAEVTIRGDNGQSTDDEQLQLNESFHEENSEHISLSEATSHTMSCEEESFDDTNSGEKSESALDKYHTEGNYTGVHAININSEEISKTPPAVNEYPTEENCTEVSAININSEDISETLPAVDGCSTETGVFAIPEIPKKRGRGRPRKYIKFEVPISKAEAISNIEEKKRTSKMNRERQYDKILQLTEEIQEKDKTYNSYTTKTWYSAARSPVYTRSKSKSKETTFSEPHCSVRYQSDLVNDEFMSTSDELIVDVENREPNSNLEFENDVDQPEDTFSANLNGMVIMSDDYRNTREDFARDESTNDSEAYKYTTEPEERVNPSSLEEMMTRSIKGYSDGNQSGNKIPEDNYNADEHEEQEIDLGSEIQIVDEQHNEEVELNGAINLSQDNSMMETAEDNQLGNTAVPVDKNALVSEIEEDWSLSEDDSVQDAAQQSLEQDTVANSKKNRSHKQLNVNKIKGSQCKSSCGSSSHNKITHPRNLDVESGNSVDVENPDASEIFNLDLSFMDMSGGMLNLSEIQEVPQSTITTEEAEEYEHLNLGKGLVLKKNFIDKGDYNTQKYKARYYKNYNLLETIVKNYFGFITTLSRDMRRTSTDYIITQQDNINLNSLEEDEINANAGNDKFKQGEGTCVCGKKFVVCHQLQNLWQPGIWMGFDTVKIGDTFHFFPCPATVSQAYALCYFCDRNGKNGGTYFGKLLYFKEPTKRTPKIPSLQQSEIGSNHDHSQLSQESNRVSSKTQNTLDNSQTVKKRSYVKKFGLPRSDNDPFQTPSEPSSTLEESNGLSMENECDNEEQFPSDDYDLPERDSEEQETTVAVKEHDIVQTNDEAKGITLSTILPSSPSLQKDSSDSTENEILTLHYQSIPTADEINSLSSLSIYNGTNEESLEQPKNGTEKQKHLKLNSIPKIHLNIPYVPDFMRQAKQSQVKDIKNDEKRVNRNSGIYSTLNHSKSHSETVHCKLIVGKENCYNNRQNASEDFNTSKDRQSELSTHENQTGTEPENGGNSNDKGESEGSLGMSTAGSSNHVETETSDTEVPDLNLSLARPLLSNDTAERVINVEPVTAVDNHPTGNQSLSPTNNSVTPQTNNKVKPASKTSKGKSIKEISNVLLAGALAAIAAKEVAIPKEMIFPGIKENHSKSHSEADHCKLIVGKENCYNNRQNAPEDFNTSKDRQIELSTHENQTGTEPENGGNSNDKGESEGSLGISNQHVGTETSDIEVPVLNFSFARPLLSNDTAERVINVEPVTAVDNHPTGNQSLSPTNNSVTPQTNTEESNNDPIVNQAGSPCHLQGENQNTVPKMPKNTLPESQAPVTDQTDAIISSVVTWSSSQSRGKEASVREQVRYADFKNFQAEVRKQIKDNTKELRRLIKEIEKKTKNSNVAIPITDEEFCLLTAYRQFDKSKVSNKGSSSNTTESSIVFPVGTMDPSMHISIVSPHQVDPDNNVTPQQPRHPEVESSQSQTVTSLNNSANRISRPQRIPEHVNRQYIPMPMNPSQGVPSSTIVSRQPVLPVYDNARPQRGRDQFRNQLIITPIPYPENPNSRDTPRTISPQNRTVRANRVPNRNICHIPNSNLHHPNIPNVDTQNISNTRLRMLNRNSQEIAQGPRLQQFGLGSIPDLPPQLNLTRQQSLSYNLDNNRVPLPLNTGDHNATPSRANPGRRRKGENRVVRQ